MKQPKSTRNKNGEKKFDFSPTLNLESMSKLSKRKMSEDQKLKGAFSSRKEKEEKEKINISPVSSDDENPSNPKQMLQNNLSGILKGSDNNKSHNLDYKRVESNKLQNRKISQFKIEKESRYKASQSIGGK
jgi:hypothetical protein